MTLTLTRLDQQGPFCEIDSESCAAAADLCQNGGTCVDEEDPATGVVIGRRCICAENFGHVRVVLGRNELH